MKLYAISDLHLGFPANRALFATLTRHAEDWLIVAGDVGETTAHMELMLQIATDRFARVIWVPGNHELWTVDKQGPRGEEKYQSLVATCRKYGALTPEDPFVVFDGPGGPCVIAPLFVLYDYSFRPPEIPVERALDWAMDAGLLCADEQALDPYPFANKPAWCAARLALSAARLAAIPKTQPIVLINHFPLQENLAFLPAIPRFKIWCGTTATESWHRDYNVKVVVSGHLHLRRTDWIDGVRFEEVSLGYPRHWDEQRSLEHYLREILPGPPPPTGPVGPQWRR